MTVRDRDLSDSALMAAVYRDDDSAFKCLGERWWTPLFRFFCKLGFGAEDAEDLAQDTMVRLFQTKERQSFDTRQPLPPFLFTIARRLAIEEWRKRPPAGCILPLLEGLDAACCAAGLPDDLLDALFTCLWELSEEEQFYLTNCGKHGLGELSHNEIGAILGKWPAQVTALGQRARGRLRERLSELGYR